jgi:hypothetical protein
MVRHGRRAEKRREAQRKRDAIRDKLLEVIKEALENGVTTAEAFKAADAWINQQVAKVPQDKQLYVQAARELLRDFQTPAEKKGPAEEPDQG